MVQAERKRLEALETQKIQEFASEKERCTPSRFSHCLFLACPLPPSALLATLARDVHLLFVVLQTGRYAEEGRS